MPVEDRAMYGSKPLMRLCLLLCAFGAAGCATPPSAHPHALAMHPHGAADAAQTPPAARPAEATPAIVLDRLSELKDILPALERKRVVYVGETHDEYAHHLMELEIIRRLHQADPRLAIGVEFFQQPFQAKLDDYTAGRLGERDMLRATGYFERWGYDYRLYAPIVRFARDHGLPIVALNVPAELVKKVRERGLDGLAAEDRPALPSPIDRSDPDYAARIREVYQQHPHHEGSRFERFLDVQLLWDEGMAQRAADYLREHPGYRMVVLTGSGHVAFGGGVPKRLNRRLPVDSAIVLNGWQGPLGPGLADYLLVPDEQTLAPAGRIGVTLEHDGKAMKVVSCAAGGACAAAGLKKGDEMVAIDGVPVADMNDVRVLMWDRRPGETLKVTMRRNHLLAGPKEQELRIELR
jgi:uncharacterized iron-regulated protein